ncbi:amino acid ABC transporter permease [Streptomyces sp. NPDC056785]|uniref:amino acid ABC transporter permease n=1 Tax=Streptomyces sp. NPDC056785 TaxID=3345944 RepID=UPI00367E2E4B
MAWDEWEQVKAAVAERHSTGTQSGLLPAGGGGSPLGQGAGRDGGSGTLRHSSGPWNRAASTADALRISARSTTASLRSSHTGVSAGPGGLAGLGVLKTVLGSWEKRLEAVRDECDALEPELRAVARDLGEVDRGVAAGVRAVPVPEGSGRR